MAEKLYEKALNLYNRPSKENCDTCVYHDYSCDVPPCDTCLAMHEDNINIYPAYRRADK